jgi:hypothetical protein
MKMVWQAGVVSVVVTALASTPATASSQKLQKPQLSSPTGLLVDYKAAPSMGVTAAPR